MAGILDGTNQLFNAGMGILSANQRSPVYQNPVDSMQKGLMQGQLLKRQQQQDMMKQQEYDMKMKEYQAQQAAAQQKQAQIETFISTLPPDQQAAARINPNGFATPPEAEKAPASGMMKDPVTGKWVMNPDYERFNDEKSVLGKPTTTVNSFEEKANQPLTGSERESYRMKDGSPLPVGVSMTELRAMGDEVIPIDKRVEDTQKVFDEAYAVEDKKLSSIEGSLGVYREVLKETGPKLFPDAAKLRLESAYNEVKVQLKELAELGVLTGDDVLIIEGMAVDPTSFKASYIARHGEGALDAQLQLIQDKIDRERGISKRVYRQKDNIDDLVKKYGS